MPVQAIPSGYHTLTPYLVVPDGARLIEFLKQAFAATVTERMEMPDGTVSHAEVKIGNSMLMLGSAQGEHKPMPCMLYLYVEDADATYKQAMQAGATSISEPENKFYGDRSGAVKDMFDNQWWIGTHVEDVPHDELVQRAAKHKG